MSVVTQSVDVYLVVPNLIQLLLLIQLTLDLKTIKASKKPYVLGASNLAVKNFPVLYIYLPLDSVGNLGPTVQTVPKYTIPNDK